MNPKSHTLFHFTKSRETLKQIIRNGFWPRFCLEDVSWLGYEEFPFIAYPIVCFCDIPLSRIQEHVGFYGEFGLGLTKEWAETNGLNPVLYVSSENSISKSFRELNEHANNLNGEKQHAAKTTMRYLFAYAKPTIGTMVVEGKPVQKEFYQESEWRFIPKHPEISEYLKRSEFDDANMLASANALTKEKCSVRFSPKDIKYIFVKTDADIPDIINFIQKDMDEYPSADLKVLMSRVTSLESITNDL